jgi:CBS domain-containing protein
MNCGEVAKKPPITITPDKTVEEAAVLMADNHVGLLVIVDKNNPKKPIGVISERDIIRTIAGKAPLTVTVDKAGTMHNFIYVYADEPVTAAARKMKQYNVRHIVVLDRNGELHGVISIRDLIGEKQILDILARDWTPTKE